MLLPVGEFVNKIPRYLWDVARVMSCPLIYIKDEGP